MKAVASRVTDPKSDMLLLPAVDMDDSGPYEIAEPRAITALETYTPSWLQTPRLKRLAEIVSAQAVAAQESEEEANGGPPVPDKDADSLQDSHTEESKVHDIVTEEKDVMHINGHAEEQQVA